MPNVFVYGTLRYGGRNHFYIEDAICLMHQCWIKGSLFDTCHNYPAMKENKSDRIYGELYRVTRSQLKAIDDLEGFVEGGVENLYNRTTALVYNDMGEETNAIIYTAGQSLREFTKRIPSGDWFVYHYLMRRELLYFAYGSCMDDERFKLAGVADYFTEVEGRGILEEFEFRFSRVTDDGGKADLIENKKDKVEGKVYRIPFDAITYLYKREGVYTGSYRPAVVPVSIGGHTYKALTFIGIEKAFETAPTELYATEILRGGKEILSHAYIHKLQQKIDRL